MISPADQVAGTGPGAGPDGAGAGADRNGAHRESEQHRRRGHRSVVRGTRPISGTVAETELFTTWTPWA
ncbi:hypothetical protein [Actinoplanes sp. NPDC049802]|uniref:hypothetical protein n=1 Tax=Actinoplanes sp. NPDC049802 TaxID=3154742 RepID=UPI0033D88EB7